MFLDTYKKEFIAQAAIELMKEVVRYDMEHGVINADTQNEEPTNAIEWQAKRAALMAEKLAERLEEGWYDGSHTVFFDPEDQPTHGCDLIADAIREYTEKYFKEP